MPTSPLPAPVRSYAIVDGQPAVGDYMNVDLNTLYAVLAGGLGDAHFATNANVSGLRLADGTVTQAKMALGNQAILQDLKVVTGGNFVCDGTLRSVTGLSSTFTFPTTSRSALIMVRLEFQNDASAGDFQWEILNTAGSNIYDTVAGVRGGGLHYASCAFTFDVPAAGSVTYSVKASLINGTPGGYIKAGMMAIILI